ncbi:hypothetical protein [Desulfolutivibrio sulfoxidireducens]|uniref:hypothetical protein n=1 Tax=Desulfolutivibrio sulfoxidireducens TaxID=2773299 RepID=UPI00159D879A|nr:hypothetical protein [Desulfolutivibrio sulfoxidireducens]QLA16969.1 hypothetical protein GD605_13145 [Desulfolutivibrio sulfoxidireducens]QLA20536.1 hypothetical protein GD604_12860 [Desulfolutivibrio sulfoxidireducens]
MIVVDGRTTGMSIQNFENLEELLLKVMEDENLGGRVVTDVFVNKEAFSEIYPHQAEDIEAREIESVEIRTVPATEMAVNITEELDKVITLMDLGARGVSDLFRQAQDAEALEIYRDLLDVIQDFMGMIGLLRQEYGGKNQPAFVNASEEISTLFSEMLEVVENEDWILLSDLLEYEFIPAVSRWKQVVDDLRGEIRETAKV